MSWGEFNFQLLLLHELFALKGIRAKGGESLIEKLKKKI